MANYKDVSDYVKDMFDEGFVTADLDRLLTLKVLDVENQKDVIKPAAATPIIRFLNSIDVFMFVNEEIFLGLEEVSQRILVEEAVAMVQYDDEKNKVKVDKGDLHTPSLFLRKYGLDAYEAAKLNIVQVKEQLKEQKNG
jgi:hypothetical protein